MDSFNQPGLWDLSLPPSLPALADDDFIALLQKQFGINNGFPVPLNNSFTKDLSALAAQNNTTPAQTANIDPQSLSRVPLPRNAPAPESPPSDDSSPSPSNGANEPSGSRSRRQSTIFGNDEDEDDGHDEDPSLKRKASEDDLVDEPTHKSQHTNVSSGATSASSKKASRRKSTGNPSADDSRLQKRKEQNRAAQRAFRERKEKHVKDLEDQVAALEQKNATTSQENESLREVVSRLQSENMRLRQSSFTFSIPHSTTPNHNVTNGIPQKPNPMGSFHSPPSTTTSSTASTHDSPQSLFANDKDVEANNDPLSFLNGNLSMLTSMDGTGAGNGSEHASQTATSDAMNMDFGFGPSNTVTPYTTIASNPLFMSFREPDAFDPMLSLQNRDRAASSASLSTKSVQSPFDFSTSSSSSGHMPQINNGGNINGNGGIPSWQDIPMSDMQAFDLTLSNSLDELFGNVYGTNTSSSQSAPSPNPSSFDFLTGFSHLTRMGSGSSTSTVSSISPITHHVSPPLSQSGSNLSTTAGPSCDGKKRCTKEQMRQYVAADTGSMFAQGNSESSLISDESPNPAAVSESPEAGVKNGRPSAEQMDQMAMKDNAECGDDGECNEFPRCKGLQLPKTTKSDKNVEVMRAWRSIRQDPNFKDIDINELCSEFASKAKCDGCQVVIDPEGMQEILEAAQRQRRRKQQSELFRTSEMVLAGADQMGLEVAK